MVVTLERNGERQRFELNTDANAVLLSDILQQCGIPFDMPCGGRGTCRKCRVHVSGAVLPPEAPEQENLMVRLRQKLLSKGKEEKK